MEGGEGEAATDESAAQMKHLLLKCHHEQRPPRADELRLWKPAVAARRDTGLFDLMDDDLLTETLARLPIKRRILFVINLSKQFAYLATHRKLFRTLYLVRGPMSLPRHLAEDEDVLLNVTDEVGSWRLFADTLEELFINIRPKYHFAQNANASAPLCHLKNLVSLSLHGFDNNKHSLSLTKLLMFIDLRKLKELKLGCGLEGDDWSSMLLKAACNLELVDLVDLEWLHLDVSKVLDAWWTAHGGVPPLRYLRTENADVVKLSLQRLDLEEIVVDSLGRYRITKGVLPGQWMLSVYWDMRFYEEIQRQERLKHLPAAAHRIDFDDMLSDFTTLLQCSPGLSAHVTIQHDPYQRRLWNRIGRLKAKLLDYILGKYPHLTFGTDNIALPKEYSWNPTKSAPSWCK
jgi:hypothetical protein